jgi:predicted transcriptional regulator
MESVMKGNMVIHKISEDTGINQGRVHLILKQLDYAGIIKWNKNIDITITSLGKSLYEKAIEIDTKGLLG